MDLFGMDGLPGSTVAAQGSNGHLALGRLRSLASQERDLYARLFSTVGGNLSDASSGVGGSDVAQLLQRTGLPQPILRHIWEQADNRQSGALDFEAFCVACRLCAHAQQRHHQLQVESLATMLGDAAVAEVPHAPPRFEDPASGAEAATEGGTSYGNGPSATRGGCGSWSGCGARDPALGCRSSESRSAHTSFNGFDFESIAFGAGPTSEVGGRPPSLPVSNYSVPPVEDIQRVGSGRAWDANEEHDSTWRGNGNRDDADTGWNGPPSHESFTQVFSPSITGKRSASQCSVSDALGKELCDTRQRLDYCLGEKATLERRARQARQTLNDSRERRNVVSKELALRKSDVEHLFTALDFSRQRIEEVERGIAGLREARVAFTADDLAAAGRKLNALTDSASSDPSLARLDLDAAREAQGRAALLAAEDRRNADELSDRLRRALRKKQTLQGRHQLLLEQQREGAQEQSRLQKAIGEDRDHQLALQAERLRVGEEHQSLLQEAMRLAQNCGLGAQSVRDLLSEQGSDKDERRQTPSVTLTPHGGEDAVGCEPQALWRTPHPPAARIGEGTSAGHTWSQPLSGQESAAPQCARWESFGTRTVKKNEQVEAEIASWAAATGRGRTRELQDRQNPNGFGDNWPAVPAG